VTGLPHHLMKGRCGWCGGRLRYGNLPNRGPVMVHAKGEGERCRRMVANGQDLVSRAERQREQDQAREAARLAFKARAEAARLERQK
jgi:hypothetical protein